jgi:hypothetical protein
MRLRRPGAWIRSIALPGQAPTRYKDVVDATQLQGIQ